MCSISLSLNDLVCLINPASITQWQMAPGKRIPTNLVCGLIDHCFPVNAMSLQWAESPGLLAYCILKRLPQP